jgi:hypothetical protein
MRMYIEALRTCTMRRVCSRESLRTCHGGHYMAKSGGKSRSRKKTFSTFERSIIGCVKNTTDLDPSRLSASNPICFLPKKLTHKKVCDIHDAVVQTRLLAGRGRSKCSRVKVVGTSYSNLQCCSNYLSV